MVYSSISDGKGPAKIEKSTTVTRGGDGYSETHQSYANSHSKVDKVDIILHKTGLKSLIHQHIAIFFSVLSRGN